MHEIGHSFGTTHDASQENGCYTVMNDLGPGYCIDDHFASKGKTEIANRVPQSTCPRSGTG
ncbi:MAG: hypothetical protein LC624_10035 [Halobacteriales archaeon]|nr:hypothetical protein [Halobacteriales archaeon]